MFACRADTQPVHLGIVSRAGCGVYITIYEDGDFGMGLRGGSLNYFACHSLESDQMDPKFTGFKVDE